MAKKKTEKKFRWVRLALSNDAFANLEGLVTKNRSRSKIITELLEHFADCPLAWLNIVAANAERRILTKRLQNGEDVLDIRRGQPTENKENDQL